MEAAERIGGRFVVEEEVASGGMGRVLRARDTETQELVAVKTILRADANSIARFERECRALAEIGHPGIVGYVSHGVLPGGDPFLVMQWLSGRDLAQFFRQYAPAETMVHVKGRPVKGPRGLSIRDVVTLGLRVSSALGALHRAGIVHRDVKPSNIFLPDGTVDNAKLVDLGTVRTSGASRDLTQTGAVIGTPYYMSPEQARGDHDVGAPADVFGLGCVLYECLTGQCPFYASNFVAVLGRILLDEPEPLGAQRPDAPPALVEVIGNMLVKDVALRLPDGEAVATLLAALRDKLSLDPRDPKTPETMAEASASLVGSGVSAKYPAMSSVGQAERRLSCFLWARSQTPIDPVLVRSHGAVSMELGGGATIIAITNVASASEQAVRTGRLALAIRASRPDAAISIATGQVDAALGIAPMGTDVAMRASTTLQETKSGTIVIDAVTSALVAGAFTLSAPKDGVTLLAGDAEVHGPTTARSEARKLVGRKKELSQLTATLEECIDESVARGIVVTAAAGVGKTRLREELEELIAQRDDVALVLRAQADLAGSGSTFGLVASALRRAAGIRASDDDKTAAERAAKLVTRVPADKRARVGAFVSELCGISAGADEDDVLRAARGDPTLFGMQVRAAWEELLRAETEHGAVVMLLDNLHSADAPSIRLVLSALAAHAQRPFFVLALGRPELRVAHPDLLARRGVVELPLEPLGMRASRSFVEDALGKSADEALVSTIVERAGGNAFYLEELVRAAQAGTSGRLPESILGLAQARLATLAPEARRVLRAASVLGEVLWASGVEQMIGASGMAFGTSEWLDDLTRKEILVVRPESRFPGEREFAFQHSLVREAAYAMLTPEDRARAHAAAAVWLQQAGETDPLVLAMHHREGGDLAAAAELLAKAAERAMERNDPAAAVARANEAIEAGAALEVRGRSLAIVAAVAASSGEYDVAIDVGSEASGLVPRGSRAFFGGLGAALQGLAARGRMEDFDRECARLIPASPEKGAGRARLGALCHVAAELVLSGRRARAIEAVRRVRALVEHGHGVDERLAGEAERVIGLHAGMIGDVPMRIAAYTRAVGHAERAGDARSVSGHLGRLALAYLEAGDLERALVHAQRAVATAVELRTGGAGGLARLALGLVLASERAPKDDARKSLEEAHAELSSIHDHRAAAWAEAGLAELDLAAGDAASAEVRARRAVEALAHTPSARPWAMALLARALVALGRPAEAIEPARVAASLVLGDDGLLFREALPPLVLAEVLGAAGDVAGAREVTSSAVARLLDRARTIEDPELFACYLAAPDAARTLALDEAAPVD